jgi:hypothetical protein
MRFDHVASRIVNANHKHHVSGRKRVVFSRELELAAQLYFPGGRYFTVFFVAWSTSSGVISTVIRDWTAPLALTANERAAASTLLGRSAMTTKSSLPKA